MRKTAAATTIVVVPILRVDDRLNGASERRPGRQLPLACSLSGPELAERRGELEEIFEGCLRMDELDDGYEFLFPGSGEWAAGLTEFVVSERGCCPFIVFELVFEPEAGPIRLRVRGPEGVKGIVAETFAGRAG
jgi:hypothetical protein